MEVGALVPEEGCALYDTFEALPRLQNPQISNPLLDTAAKAVYGFAATNLVHRGTERKGLVVLADHQQVLGLRGMPHRPYEYGKHQRTLCGNTTFKRGERCAHAAHQEAERVSCLSLARTAGASQARGP